MVKEKKPNKKTEGTGPTDHRAVGDPRGIMNRVLDTNRELTERVLDVMLYKNRVGFIPCESRYEACSNPESLGYDKQCVAEFGMDCPFYKPYYLMARDIPYAAMYERKE